MDRTEFLEKVAPCSLMCHTCGSYKNGVICKAAGWLYKYMDGLKEFYETHNQSQAENFNIFFENLESYSAGSCSGCRSKKDCRCSIKGCFILECTMNHKVDFCGECVEFPCNKTNTLFEDKVFRQWLSGNREIQKNGIEAFWEKNCEKPHYQAYKHF